VVELRAEERLDDHEEHDHADAEDSTGQTTQGAEPRRHRGSQADGLKSVTSEGEPAGYGSTNSCKACMTICVQSTNSSEGGIEGGTQGPEGCC